MAYVHDACFLLVGTCLVIRVFGRYTRVGELEDVRSRFYESAQAMLAYRSNPITSALLGASQVTAGKLAYRLSAPIHKTGS